MAAASHARSLPPPREKSATVSVFANAKTGRFDFDFFADPGNERTQPASMDNLLVITISAAA
jgi:hypothetical protein